MSIQITATGGVVRIGQRESQEIIPPEVLADLCQFLLDKRTGNVILHVKDGHILGAEYPLRKTYR